MVEFYSDLNKNNVKIKLNLQNYAHACTFIRYQGIFSDFLKFGGERYTRQAVREMSKIVVNHNLKVVITYHGATERHAILYG